MALKGNIVIIKVFTTYLDMQNIWIFPKVHAYFVTIFATWLGAKTGAAILC